MAISPWLIRKLMHNENRSPVNIVGVAPSLGYHAFDALHLSSAEAGRADVLLTTDDRFIRRARRSVGIAAPSCPEPDRMGTGASIVMQVEDMTDEQFDRYALEVLQREFGPDGLARFFRLHRSGKGDYTRDRSKWQKDLTVDQIVATPNRPPSQ